ALPAQLIAFSSSSSIASLPALIESGERGLDLPPRVTGFVLPFAVSTFKIAAPGVPRGAFIMLTPLFLAIGLPAEGIGILIAVDALPDTFATALNVTGDLAAAALVAVRTE